MKFKIGDKVIVNGDLYVSSNANYPNGKVINKVTYITRIAQGSKHPYNTTGDLGWMNESDIRFYEEPKEEYTCEIEVVDNDNLVEYLKEHDGKVIIMKEEDLKKVFNKEF